LVICTEGMKAPLCETYMRLCLDQNADVCFNRPLTPRWCVWG